RQDAPELVLPQKLQPRHALPLVGTQYVFERAQWRARKLRLATLLRRAFAPASRGLHLPAGLLAQRGVEEARLHVAEAIALRVLCLSRSASETSHAFCQRG